MQKKHVKHAGHVSYSYAGHMSFPERQPTKSCWTRAKNDCNGSKLMSKARQDLAQLSEKISFFWAHGGCRSGPLVNGRSQNVRILWQSPGRVPALVIIAWRATCWHQGALQKPSHCCLGYSGAALTAAPMQEWPLLWAEAPWEMEIKR